MTDWDRIREEIQRAMTALDKAKDAREALRNGVTPATIDTFKDQMRELRKNLCEADDIFKHEFDFSIDELVDMYTKISGGKPAPHRTSPRFRGKIGKKKILTKP